jgi:hypothetical protein
MSAAIAFLAGMGAGYLDQQDRNQDKAFKVAVSNREQKRADDSDARAQQSHDAQMRQITQSESDRAALRTAAAPAAVVPVATKDDTQDNVDVGQPNEPAPTVTGYRVGAQQFASQGVADSAAAAANDPKSVRARVQGAMAAQDPLKADQYRTSGLQADAAELTLKKHTEDLIKEGTLDALGAAIQGQSPEEIKALYNQSGGKKIASIQVNPYTFNHPSLGPQKSATITGKFEDGTDLNVPDAFQLSTQLMGAAKRFDLLGKWADEKRKADNDAGHLKIAQQNANTQEQYRRDQAENTRLLREIQQQKASQPGQPLQITLKDKRDFENDLSQHIKDQYPIKEGIDATERDKMAASANARRALGQTLFETNAAVGIPTTAGTVLQALELAADRKNVRIVQVNGQPHEGVIVNGQAIITSGVLQRREQPAPGGNVATPGGQPAPASTPNPAPLTGTTIADIQRQLRSAAMAASGVQPQSAPPQAQPATGTAAAMAAMEPYNAQVAQSAQMLAAVANSGDQAAIQRYAAELDAARAARRKAAQYQFGQAAGLQYLTTLPQ